MKADAILSGLCNVTGQCSYANVPGTPGVASKITIDERQCAGRSNQYIYAENELVGIVMKPHGCNRFGWQLSAKSHRLQK